MFDVIKKDDGKEYVKSKSSILKIDPEVTYYQFDNLFNGDERLGNKSLKFAGVCLQFFFYR